MNETPKNCLHCGIPMQTQRATKKYCSDNCKQEAYIKRTAVQGNVLTASSEVQDEEDELPETNFDSNPESENQSDDTIVQEDEDFEDEESNNEEIEPDNPEPEISPSKKREMAKLDIDLMIMGKPKIKQIEQPIETNSKNLKDKETDEEFEYRRSTLVNLVEEYLEDNDKDSDMFLFPNKYWYDSELVKVKWVSVRIRSLIETILYLNQFRRIETKHVKTLVKGMTEMMYSLNYKFMPENYPFKNYLKEQHQRLKKAADEDSDEIWMPVLEPERKARLIGIRFQLAALVPKIRFSKLDFKR